MARIHFAMLHRHEYPVLHNFSMLDAREADIGRTYFATPNKPDVGSSRVLDALPEASLSICNRMILVAPCVVRSLPKFSFFHTHTERSREISCHCSLRN
jgi:hypothetical protein